MSHHLYRPNRWCADYPLVDPTVFPGTRVPLRACRGLGSIPMVSQRPAMGSVRISSTMTIRRILSSTYPARGTSWQPRRCTSSQPSKETCPWVKCGGSRGQRELQASQLDLLVVTSITRRRRGAQSACPFQLLTSVPLHAWRAKDGNIVTDDCPLSRWKTGLGSVLIGLHWT